jgi:hypothetical protein
MAISESRLKRLGLEEGIPFECSRCGKCCSGSPGYVYFSRSELEAMAKHLGLLPFEFLQKYTRKLDGWSCFNEVATEHGLDCVFLARDETTGKARCSIHSVRPSQCRTWPFWSENLASKEALRRAAEDCPGLASGLEKKGMRPVAL